MSLRGGLTAEQRRAYSRIRQLLNEPGLLRGNLIEMRRACGKKSCRCRAAQEHRHRAVCLSVSIGGKRHTVYIPAAWEERVREWVGRYAELRGFLEEISASFLKQLRERQE